MKKILFVCMGNICRSPAAEGVMQKIVEEEKLIDKILCDSAGTIGYHQGEPADHRMRRVASARGYILTSLSRRVDPISDFKNFDYIIAMDKQNLADLRAMDADNSYAKKIHLMCDFCQTIKEQEVPDPYYGGADHFEKVLDILEDACSGLLLRVKKDLARAEG